MILEYYRNEKQKGMSISFAYINAMAKNWSDEGISSIGEAEEKLQEIERGNRVGMKLLQLQASGTESRPLNREKWCLAGLMILT